MFNGVSSRDNLPTIKDGAYVLNLDEKQSKRTNSKANPSLITSLQYKLMILWQNHLQKLKDSIQNNRKCKKTHPETSISILLTNKGTIVHQIPITFEQGDWD